MIDRTGAPPLEYATVVIEGEEMGVVAALGLTRLLSSMLFGVSSADALTYLVVLSLLSGVALAACWIPARQATRADPMLVIRSE